MFLPRHTNLSFPSSEAPPGRRTLRQFSHFDDEDDPPAYKKEVLSVYGKWKWSGELDLLDSVTRQKKLNQHIKRKLATFGDDFLKPPGKTETRKQFLDYLKQFDEDEEEDEGEEDREVSLGDQQVPNLDEDVVDTVSAADEDISSVEEFLAEGSQVNSVDTTHVTAPITRHSSVPLNNENEDQERDLDADVEAAEEIDYDFDESYNETFDHSLSIHRGPTMLNSAGDVYNDAEYHAGFMVEESYQNESEEDIVEPTVPDAHQPPGRQVHTRQTPRSSLASRRDPNSRDVSMDMV